MSDDSYDASCDPKRETKVGRKGEKDTLGGRPRNSRPPFKEGDMLHEFAFEKLLGAGTSGFVYRALDTRTNRRCALKLLTNDSPDDLLRNKLGFRRMMSIEHPNLLRVDRIYQLDHHIALSMEEIEGVTLHTAMKGFKKLDPNDAYQKLLQLMHDYASGLAMMHAKGYIHRDLKPENLMVDENGRGRVIDYGLVDAYELDQATYSARGYLVGTPRYMAPEVIWSQRYLPAGDVFSLGIVMMDALASVQARAGRSLAELERGDFDLPAIIDAKKIDEAIDGLSESIPRTIRDACREMLERQPGDRPTALQVSRLGLPRTPQLLPWTQEQELVGRDAEYRDIVAWVEDIFCGKVGRLHLSGPSGIGKSRLIKEVRNFIGKRKWAQVYSAKCRVREDQPLQAFDQICDAITNNYLKGDRGRLELDQVSVEILQTIFPVLESIFSGTVRLATPGETGEQIDALEAAARMSEAMRQMGPLFLIIDDSQWSDRDSLNVLDRLRGVVGKEGLGIITVSRDEEDQQRIAASKHIRLRPLDPEDSHCILAKAADRWGIEVSAPLLQQLAEATNGSPFRLRELADEFRPGGVLSELTDDSKLPDESLSELGPVDQLWRRRAQRLSPEAKRVLTYVVTSGGRVSTQQLGQLTELGDSVDAAVSELARQRLIMDEATGGECISIFHDHVADELIGTLSDEDNASAHHDWAMMLSENPKQRALAARIAGHFFAAGAPVRAVGHSLLAAEDAEEREATAEAGKWYARVIDFVEAEEKVAAVRKAAHCYKMADFPLEAAGYYQQLSEMTAEKEQVECQLLAISLLIRSGRFAGARDQLQRFAKSMSLPRPKPPWQSKLVLLTGHSIDLLRGRSSLMNVLPPERSTEADADSTTLEQDHESVEPCDEPIDQCDKAAEPNHNLLESIGLDDEPSKEAPGTNSTTGSVNEIKQRALRFCDALIRPMSVFDNLYAAELSAAGSRLARKFGTPSQRIHFAIGESVFACYDRGNRRIEGETNLLALKSQVSDLGCAYTTGDLWSGIAYSHALACRWDQVAQPVQASLQHYRNAENSNGFEVAHTRWLDLWAKWNLGRWESMSEIAVQMLDDALRRNDLLQQLLTTSGYGGSAWLVSDRIDQWRRLRSANLEFGCDSQPTQILHVFDWIAMVQCLLYEGQYEEAWRRFESLEPEIQRLPFSRFQLFRVSRSALGAMIAIHNLNRGFTNTWRLRTQVRIDQLRHEQLTYTTTLANFFEGLLQLCIARHHKNSAAQEFSRQLLSDTKNQAYLLHLRPYQLAAEDKLAEIQTGQSLGRLEQRMEKQGVARPKRLMRLFTLPVE